MELRDTLARRAYHERAERSRGATAQNLYDLFCRSVRQASRDSFRLRWFAETIGTRGQAVTLAIGTAGVLLVVENWLKTAFLPGQGDAQAVLDQRESRGPRGESPRAGRRGMRPDVPGDSPGRDREDREQRRREEAWNDGQKLYYKVFRPAVQFVRSHYEIEFDARGERKRGEYGLLKSACSPDEPVEVRQLACAARAGGERIRLAMPSNLYVRENLPATEKGFATLPALWI